MTLAGEMHANGTMDEATYRKTTMRDVNKVEAVELAPLSGEQIRALREQAHMSQAVFARCLNLTVGYVRNSNVAPSVLPAPRSRCSM